MASTKSTLPLTEAPKLAYNDSPEVIDDLIHHLNSSRVIEYTNDTKECASRSYTKHSFAYPHQVPSAIFYPKTTADVSAIVKAAHERNIAITAYSGGTSVSGALAATRGKFHSLINIYTNYPFSETKTDCNF